MGPGGAELAGSLDSRHRVPLSMHLSSLMLTVPQLIMPLRGALRSTSADVIQAGLHAIELLIGCCPEGGASLLPYCRQLLPALSR